MKETEKQRAHEAERETCEVDRLEEEAKEVKNQRGYASERLERETIGADRERVHELALARLKLAEREPEQGGS